MTLYDCHTSKFSSLLVQAIQKDCNPHTYKGRLCSSWMPPGIDDQLTKRILAILSESDDGHVVLVAEIHEDLSCLNVRDAPRDGRALDSLNILSLDARNILSLDGQNIKSLDGQNILSMDGQNILSLELRANQVVQVYADEVFLKLM